IANFTWGGGVLLITWYTFIAYTRFVLDGIILLRHALITILITLWAVRLIVYVYLRYKGTDPRFATWKLQGMYALFINIGYIFIGQFALMIVMSAPPIAINMSSVGGFTLLDALGLVIWCIGYFFEAVSDAQLFQFTSDPANKGK